jgi:hypothetical protein
MGFDTIALVDRVDWVLDLGGLGRKSVEPGARVVGEGYWGWARGEGGRSGLGGLLREP